MPRGTRILAIGEWDGEKERILNHGLTDALAKFEDVAADVTKEVVAAPATEKHNDIDGDALEIHCHGGATAEGVEADGIGGVTQGLNPDDVHGMTKAFQEGGSWYEAFFASDWVDDEIDQGFVGRARIASDALDCESSIDHGTQ
jgi:hypothetical protein